MPDDKGALYWGERIEARLAVLETERSERVQQLLREIAELRAVCAFRGEYLEQCQSENETLRRRVLLLETQLKEKAHGAERVGNGDDRG